MKKTPTAKSKEENWPAQDPARYLLTLVDVRDIHIFKLFIREIGRVPLFPYFPISIAPPPFKRLQKTSSVATSFPWVSRNYANP
jgi:hypothetical protein